MIPPQLQAELQEARTILIAGTGGGFDFLCGLPLVMALEAQGFSVHIANLSFTPLQTVCEARWLSDSLLEVDAASFGPDYFPEGWLAKWFAARREPRSIFCFQATGVIPYQKNYELLLEKLQIDTVILIDGGVDSLLRGDEHSLGTPLWDALSIAAVNNLVGPRKILTTTAFGAERWDKISHSQALERIADLTRRDALYGVSTLVRSTLEGAAFVDAAHYIFEHQKTRPSIVVSSMLSALNGQFGELSVNAYTETTPLWISPLMCLYWFFDLSEVARQKKFLSQLQNTQTLTEAADRLHQWTGQQPASPWQNIPI
ncbi:MAG TPA: DUF1152 domain-containing protein [Abditibacteriaceae bacterium]|jgi:hypothetical protein